MANVPISKIQVPGSEDTLILKDSTAANKVQSATNDNLAALDGNGNLKDSGWSSLKTTTSASGNPISISGLKSNQLAINPIITLEPIQAGSGTPSPSNIRAISGYDKIEVLSCSKNLFDGGYSESGKYLNQDGTLTNGSSWYVTNYIVVKGGTSYTLSHSSSTSNNGICWYDASMTYIDGALWGSANTKTITLPSNAKYIRVSYYANWISTFQIEEGSTSTTYEPYTPATSISESLGQTVYWGRWKPRTGEFEVLGQIVDMGDLSWDYNSASNRLWFITPAQTDAESYSDETTVRDIVASAYRAASLNSITSDATLDGVVGLSNTKRIVVRNSAYSNAATFKTAMTGQKIVYKLDTPFTIQLTPHEIPLLKDYAYVGTNGSNIALDYHNGELASLADVSQLGETVNELGDYFNAKIKYDSVTGTTDSQGLLAFGAKGKISERFVIGAHDGTGRHIFIPFVYDTQWGAKVLSSTNGNPVTGTSITAQIAYIDLTLK